MDFPGPEIPFPRHYHHAVTIPVFHCTISTWMVICSRTWLENRVVRLDHDKTTRCAPRYFMVTRLRGHRRSIPHQVYPQGDQNTPRYQPPVRPSPGLALCLYPVPVVAVHYPIPQNAHLECPAAMPVSAPAGSAFRLTMGLQIMAETAPGAPLVIKLGAARGAATHLGAAAVETRQQVAGITGAIIGGRGKRLRLQPGPRPTAHRHLHATDLDGGLQVEEVGRAMTIVTVVTLYAGIGIGQFAAGPRAGGHILPWAFHVAVGAVIAGDAPMLVRIPVGGRNVHHARAHGHAGGPGAVVADQAEGHHVRLGGGVAAGLRGSNGPGVIQSQHAVPARRGDRNRPCGI